MNRLKKIFLASLFMSKPSFLVASSNMDLALENTHSPTEILTSNAPEASPQFVQRSADEFESIHAKILQGPPSSPEERKKILSDTVEFMYSYDIDVNLRYQLFYSFSEQGRSVLKERIFLFLENLIQNPSPENEFILRNNIGTQLILLSSLDQNMDRIIEIFEKMVDSNFNEWNTKLSVFSSFPVCPQNLQEKLIDKTLEFVKTSRISFYDFSYSLPYILSGDLREKKEFLINETLQLMGSPEIMWGTKQDFFCGFSGLPLQFQNRLIDQILEGVRDGTIAIGEFASILSYLFQTSHEEKKEALLKTVLDILYSPDVSIENKQIFFFLFTHFPPEFQEQLMDLSATISSELLTTSNHEKQQVSLDKNFSTDRKKEMIDKLFQSVDNGSVLPEKLAKSLLAIMFGELNSDQEAKLGAIILKVIRSPELHFNIKQESFILFERTSLEIQDQILDDVSKGLDDQILSVENFFSIVPWLLNCKNEERREILLNKVVDFINSAELGWDRKIQFLSNFIQIPPLIKGQLIYTILKAFEAKTLSGEQFLRLVPMFLNGITRSENGFELNTERVLVDKAFDLIHAADVAIEIKAAILQIVFGCFTLEQKEALLDHNISIFNSLGSRQATLEETGIFAFLFYELFFSQKVFESESLVLRAKKPIFLDIALKMMNSDILDVKIKLSAASMIFQLREDEYALLKNQAENALKSMMKNPKLQLLTFDERKGFVFLMNMVNLTTEERIVIDILEQKLNFEAAYVRLDKNIDFGSPHQVVALTQSNIYLKRLLEEELHARKVLDIEGYNNLLRDIQKFLTTIKAENESALSAVVIGHLISRDVIDMALNSFAGLNNPLTNLDEERNLWHKKPDPREIPILDHDGQGINLGRIVQLVFDKLLENTSHKEYTLCAAAFVNALGSEAVTACGTGAINGILGSLTAILSPDIKEEERKFSQADRDLLVHVHFPELKTFLLQLFDHKEGVFETAHLEWKDNLVMTYFMEHIKNQNWAPITGGTQSLFDVFAKGENEQLIHDMTLLFLDTGFKVYLSEFWGGFIRNGSLKLDEINTYLEMMDSYPLR